ncbi:MAG: DNA methylase [Flavobacterium psychrophilum]|nr:MAG: DNA methylase [Flavobacterium psychrophilum]
MQKEILVEINSVPIYRNFVQNLPYNAALLVRAKKLRKMGVISEVVFWKQVKNGSFYGIDFDRQRIIGNYIVDFYVKTLGLVIEIDGSSHNDKDAYDAIRDKFLTSLGLRIYRISEFRVRNDLSNVLIELEQYIVIEFGPV